MNTIKKEIRINLPADQAFHHFVHQLNEWWPEEYTWSQEHLNEIKIEPEINGLCIEIGPYGFRCDWGRVIEYQENEVIAFNWQISPKRIPEPDPDKASLVTVQFVGDGDFTIIHFAHSQFANHGAGAEEYLKAMNSAQGWDYILERFKNYCHTE